MIFTERRGGRAPNFADWSANNLFVFPNANEIFGFFLRLDKAVGPILYGRSVVNPGTKWWRLPVEVTQFWRPRSGFVAGFL